MSKNNNPGKDKFYIAYGSNLNLEQMARRCPTAKVVKAACLRGFRLMFRGKGVAVATIERKQGGKVPMLIWRLRPNDERNLDVYEGYPRLYRKETFKVTVNGKRANAMVYVMNEASHPYGTPSRGYFKTIRQGYEDSGFDTGILRQAVLDSVWEACLADEYEGGGSDDGND